jgi:hypothetical protein
MATPIGIRMSTRKIDNTRTVATGAGMGGRRGTALSSADGRAGTAPSVTDTNDLFMPWSQQEPY